MKSETSRSKRTFTMVRIPAGWFTMGSPVGHGDRDEFPEHRVWVDEFLIGQDLVTAAELARFLNEAGNPDFTYLEPSDDTSVVLLDGIYFPRRECADHPANGVTWYGAQAYCEWLSARTGREFRLPTEAEWERAARGGREGMRYPWGNDPPAGLAQFQQSWAGPLLTLSPVGSYPPNGYGLHDMTGNLWEWCADWYQADYYHHSPTHNPTGPKEGQLKVLRGGSWGCLDVQIRCGIRVGEWPTSSSTGIGFRVARSP